MTEQLQITFSEQEAILTACNSEIKQLKEHLAIQNGNLQVLQNRSVLEYLVPHEAVVRVKAMYILIKYLYIYVRRCVHSAKV